MELIGSQGEDVIDKSGKWVKIKPKDVRKAMERHLEKEKIVPDTKEKIDIITNEEYRKESIEKVCESFINNDVVAKLIVREASGDVMFEKIKTNETDLLENKWEIIHDENIMNIPVCVFMQHWAQANSPTCCR